MNEITREVLGIERFCSIEQLWFQAMFDETELVWDILVPKRKELWISKHLETNVFQIKRSGYLVMEDSEISTRDGGTALIRAGAIVAGDDIEFGQGVEVEGGAFVAGPTILGRKTVVRHGAYIRGGVITGEKCVIGHATEVKSSILLNEAKAAHFAYVGDSILGNHVNLGAGTKISNLKITNNEVKVYADGGPINTGLRKFGAVLGDHVETGCNSVLNPGAILGQGSLVYPCISVRNRVYPDGSIIKD